MTLLLVRRKLLYVASLLIALVAIQRGTDAWVLSAVQRHEPSIRIFRSLLEIVLLLLCTAASLVVWKRFIPNSVTARLLFDGNDDKQMEDDDTDIPVTWNANDVNEDEQYDDSGDSDERAFLSTKDQPVNDRRDTLHRQSAATTESFQEQPQPQPQPQPPHHSDCDDDCNGNNDNNDVDINALNNPSPISVTSAALDLLIWILIALVFYSVAAAETIPLFLASTNYDGNNVDATTITTRLDSTATDNNITPRSSSSNNNHPQYYQGFWEALAGVAAPTFPLLLFAGATTKALYPWTRRRKQFYAVLSYTLSAPVYEVSFRDGMIGDVLTSMVRPLQDIAFTIFYILFGLQGWWSKSYFLPEAPSVDEASFNSYNVTDTSHSFLNAADSSIPAMERSWLLHTAILPACMISPLWWRFLQNMRQTYDNRQRWPYLGNALKYFAAAQVAMVGVYHPHMQQNPLWLFGFAAATLYQIYWDIFLDWGLLVQNPHTRSWQLRSQRLYPWKSMYWSLIATNALLRFCWTLSFVPLHYLSSAGVLTTRFSNDAWTIILAPTIASAEIIRRALWGLLRVEWEAIKQSSDQDNKDRLFRGSDDGLEMSPMEMQTGDASYNGSPYPLVISSLTSDMKHMSNIQILTELCLYTTAFAVLGIIIAAHRGTM